MYEALMASSSDHPPQSQPHAKHSYTSKNNAYPSSS